LVKAEASACRRDLSSDGIQAGQLKRVFMWWVVTSIHFKENPATLRHRAQEANGIAWKGKTSSGFCGFPALFTGGSSLIRYTTFASPPGTCFQEPVVEIISSVRWARQWMASEEGASRDDVRAVVSAAICGR
jgi:hypothetical protein